MEIGKEIRRKRREKDLTQKQLASEIGVSTVTVLQWEKNVFIPNSINLLKLKNKLDIQIDALLK